MWDHGWDDRLEGYYRHNWTCGGYVEFSVFFPPSYLFPLPCSALCFPFRLFPTATAGFWLLKGHVKFCVNHTRAPICYTWPGCIRQNRDEGRSGLGYSRDEWMEANLLYRYIPTHVHGGGQALTYYGFGCRRKGKNQQHRGDAVLLMELGSQH